MRIGIATRYYQFMPWPTMVIDSVTRRAAPLASHPHRFTGLSAIDLLFRFHFIIGRSVPVNGNHTPEQLYCMRLAMRRKPLPGVPNAK